MESLLNISFIHLSVALILLFTWRIVFCLSTSHCPSFLLPFQSPQLYHHFNPDFFLWASVSALCHSCKCCFRSLSFSSLLSGVSLCLFLSLCDLPLNSDSTGPVTALDFHFPFFKHTLFSFYSLFSSISLYSYNNCTRVYCIHLWLIRVKV